MRLRHRFLLLAPIVGIAFASGARAAPDASECLRIADDAARLACYDRVHQRVPSTTTTTTPPSVAPAASAAAVAAVAGSGSMFDERWDLDGRRRDELFVPRAYKPVYILPATWTDQVNRLPGSPAPQHLVAEPLDLRPVEVKYQLSFKAKLWEEVFGTPGTLWAGYTQSSRWQVYAGSASRPFRETNYEPELMFGWPIERELLGWRARQFVVSLNHQSNGRPLPLSRSWNRVIGELQLERGDWTAEFRPWLRLSEAADSDDNPDIEDHVGRAELLVTRRWHEHVVALQLRHSLRGGNRSRGSAQLEWAFPIDGTLKGHLQWFSGYGESLIDYNLRQTKLGLGVSIVGWR